MKWKKKYKILKLLWNILYKNNGKLLCSCKKCAANKDSSVRKTKQNRLTLLSKCAIWGQKNLINLNFQMIDLKWIISFKMNNIVNKFQLNGDKFMSELHLRQPGFTYSACGPFTKHRERIQMFRETGKLKHLYRT